MYSLRFFIFSQDISNFTFGLEEGPNKIIDNYYQYFQLDSSINRYPIRRDIHDFIQKEKIFFQNDGLLIIRFIIDERGNCETIKYSYLGPDDKQINISTGINKKSIDKLIFYLKNKKWEKGKVEGVYKKYHLVIKLKVTNKRISEIF